MPKFIVNPLNKFLLMIPLIGWGIGWFEEKLEGHERVQTAFPRLLAGYFFTYLIGGICLLLYFFKFGGIPI
ncbi:hypothetical protein AKJ65_00820 [candidate division MSBL1 archaeon SCGC-AAA259E19]|uniref:Uncharacterized protein n=1 Tax=candidate division MSBL1 archaeon SCGC-AAA259E19 TaxID=1698264 RepID=A0A133UNK7_9EURY|nr:hypothetical protein AKJ65_00820 [candidate division MSBL1 archaeon SCGC-AAA259E19]